MLLAFLFGFVHRSAGFAFPAHPEKSNLSSGPKIGVHFSLQSGDFYPKALKFDLAQSFTGTLYFLIDGQRSLFGDFSEEQNVTTWAVHNLGVVKSSASLTLEVGESMEMQQTSVSELATPARSIGEAANAPALTWYTGGSIPWRAEATQDKGAGVALRSGHILHDQRSILETRIEEPGILTFWWKVSSEEDYDVLAFRIGGEEKASISGSVDWRQHSTRIFPGRNVVQWVYSKDLFDSEGEDAGWVADVNFEPDDGPPVFFTQPSALRVFPGDEAALEAVVVGRWPMALQWYREGVAVDGGTNLTLNISNAQPGDSGTYHLVASNELAAVSSAPAVLNVSAEVPLDQALDTPGWVWTTGSIPWKGVADVSHDGVDAAHSAISGPERRSFLETILTGPGTLQFWWKLDAPDPSALLRISVDRSVKYEISGSGDWELVTVHMGEGTHEVRWTLWTDWEASTATNRAWVDQVSFAR